MSSSEGTWIHKYQPTFLGHSLMACRLPFSISSRYPSPQKNTVHREKHDHPLSSQNNPPPQNSHHQKKTQTPPILPTIFPIKTTPPQECTYLTPSRRAQWPWLPRHLGLSQLGPCSQRLRSSATPRERRTEEARSSWSSRLLWFTMGHFGLLWFSMVVLFFLKSILCNIYIYTCITIVFSSFFCATYYRRFFYLLLKYQYKGLEK